MEEAELEDPDVLEVRPYLLLRLPLEEPEEELLERPERTLVRQTMEEKQEVPEALHRLALRVQRLQDLPLVQIILTIPVVAEELAEVGMEAEAAEEARCRVLLNVALLVLLVVLVQVDPEDAHTPLVPLLILALEVALEAVVLDMYILQTPQANIRRDVYLTVNTIYSTHRQLMELRVLYLLLGAHKLDNLVLDMFVLLLYL